jgi:putative hydroxymethylpyrimidine transport system substrate-binding protein
VTVALPGPPSAVYGPLYAAQAAGDFAAGALRVQLIPAPGGDSLRALESHDATIAVASEPDLLAARDGGQQLVAIGALVGQPLDAIVSLARRPVTSGSQLAGTTVATDGTPLAGAELATVLGSAHVPTSRVRVIAAPAGLTAPLASHRAAAALGGPWPTEVVTLERGRHQPGVLELPRAGVPAYSGLVLVVRIDEAHYDGVLLRAFLQSLSRGAGALAANPAGATAAIASAAPGSSAAVARDELAKVAPLVAAPRAGKPFGYQDPLAWRSFGHWMHAEGLLRHADDGAAAITDEFLPGQGEQIESSS